MPDACDHKDVLADHLHVRIRSGEKLVGEAVLDRFLAGHPRLFVHHALEVVDLVAGLGGVDLGRGVDAGVQHLDDRLQVVDVAVVDHGAGGLVDHHEAARIDLHGVARAHDDARRGGRDAFDDDVDVGPEGFDGVMDGDAGVEIPAAAVQLDGDLALALHGREVIHEALGRDVEAGLRLSGPPVDWLLAHDVAVEDDLALIFGDARDVPAFLAAVVRHWLSPGQNCRAGFEVVHVSVPPSLSW